MSELRFWSVKETERGAVILPTKPLYCPVCGSPLILHDFQASKLPFHHSDIHLKCSRCGFFMTFGIPITPEEYKRLWGSPLRGKILKWELKEVQPEIYDKAGIGDKLKTWGYW